MRRADITPASVILDVGCGSGDLLRRVSAARKIGVDLSCAMAFAARRKVGTAVNVVNADVERLPFRDDKFDVVLSSSSFHFWPDRSRALREIRRVLRPNGRLVVTDWCDDFVACRLCDAFLRWRDRTALRIVSKDDCASLLRESGFEVAFIDTYKISWLWGLMTAVAVTR